MSLDSPISEENLSNENLTVTEKEIVTLTVLRTSYIGYVVAVNEVHLGLLHYNEVFENLEVGDVVKGFVKKIKEDKKIDVMIGAPGHTRVTTEAEKILKLLQDSNGFLPYHDKSEAEQIYSTFGMSKKTFKMTIGNLYKQKKIVIDADGIKLIKK